jgi:ResB-like family protein
MKLARRIVDVLASIRLAVATMGVLAAVCIAATVYESRHGTPAAQAAFYGTTWFALLLGVLAANVLLSMLRRWPWRAEHAGFVLAHVGILALLAGSVVSTQLGLDGSVALVEGGDPAAAVRLPQRAVQVEMDGGAAVAIPVTHSDQWWGEARHPLAPGVELVLTRHQPHVAVHEHVEAVETGGAPAVKYHLEGEFGREDGSLLAGDPERSRSGFGPIGFALVATADDAAARAHLDLPQGRAQAVFVADAKGGLHYALSSRKAATVRGVVVPGKAIDTPWMDLDLVVDEFLPHAALDRHLLPGEPPADGAERVPAVEARLSQGGQDGPAQWIAWGQAQRLEAPGGAVATVRFQDAAAPLPFKVALVDFDSKKYPGTRMAATYQSLVRVEDAERGTSEHLVAMNRPLHYRGYTFFQSSYAEGERMTSILAVSRAPGLPLVYSGTALLSFGIAWMFYGKPWLQRRRGLQALAAHRAGPAPAGAR